MGELESAKWAIDRMLHHKMHSHQDLPLMIEAMLKSSYKLEAIKHPDQAFQDINTKLIQALLSMQDSLSLPANEIEASWKNVTQNCLSCHDIYTSLNKSASRLEILN